MTSPCKAYRCNDEYHCGKCGLQWSIDDPEPPKCRTPVEVLRARHGLNKQEKPKCRLFPKWIESTRVK